MSGLSGHMLCSVDEFHRTTLLAIYYQMVPCAYLDPSFPTVLAPRAWLPAVYHDGYCFSDQAARLVSD